jgi:hypothetical protein
MNQYLPLFTKKIKDPKAIKKQRATRDLDYTKMREPVMSPKAPAREISSLVTSPKVALTERNIATAPESDRIIRDPRPRIVSRDKYNEI